MKHLFTQTLAFMAMTAMITITATAQHMTVDVEPGSKGALPTAPAIAQAEQGHIAALTLESVFYHHYSGWVINGHFSSNDAYEAYINFVKPEVFGGEYYTMQQRKPGSETWSDYRVNDEVRHYDSQVAFLSPVVSEDIYYRLVLHGGENDGAVSNEVFVKMPTVHNSHLTRRGYSTPNFIGVGLEVDGMYIEAQRENRGVYNSSTGKVDYEVLESFGVESTSYRRQWYRRNPNTYGMTAIEGATDAKYTPTTEDIGYELFEIVTGDDVKISFTACCNHGIVKIPILASVDRVAFDGFVLNTNYVLPNGGKGIKAMDWNSQEPESIPADCIEELKPGQYAFNTPMSTEGGAFELQYEGETFEFAFDMGGWYHIPMIEVGMYLQPIKFSVQAEGQTVPTIVDVIGKNVHGEWAIAESIDMTDKAVADTTISLFLTPKMGEGSWEEGFAINYEGDYYLKAHATNSTAETYWPNARMWADAGIVQPGYDEEYNPKAITIELLPILKPLTGEGVIEGAITVSAPKKASSKAETSDATDKSYDVMLKVKDGDIIAQTETDAAGKYRFENVPFGDYQVLVNIDGYTIKEPAEVKLTAEQPTVTAVDYKVRGNEIVPTAIRTVLSNGNASTFFDLSGRRLAQPQRGVTIFRNNGKTFKAIVR